MWLTITRVSSAINHLDKREWLIVLVIAMLLGFLCMRGNPVK